tara:strand:- start:537 stop:776 length:240 start_codon:yes stop_codon:yes gene_type:complete
MLNCKPIAPEPSVSLAGREPVMDKGRITLKPIACGEVNHFLIPRPSRLDNVEWFGGGVGGVAHGLVLVLVLVLVVVVRG